MALKNYMEDVVSDVVDIILKEKDISLSTPDRRDIIAFSLNRLPPKYIVSERGFTHSIIEEKNDPEFHANIIAVVNEAIDVVIRRPREHSADEETKNIELGPFTFDGNKYFNFPHFLGEVCSQKDLETIDKVQIKLFMDDELCEMAETSWVNPYTTKAVTGKFYSFWPKAVLKTESMEDQMSFTFKIRFDHKDYYPFEREIILLIEAEDRKYNYIRRNYTELIELTAMEMREK